LHLFSPDLNSIEDTFSKVEHILGKLSARGKEALRAREDRSWPPSLQTALFWRSYSAISGADLRGVALIGTDLSGTDLSNTNLSEMSIFKLQKALLRSLLCNRL
jgi:uncharacterized protein YjbI with pentapeptide repeats